MARRRQHPKRIRPEDKVALRLTRKERDLILEHAFLDDDTIRPLQLAEVDGTEVLARFTLTDLDDLSGAVAAVANHTESRKLQAALDAACDKIADTLRSYDDGLFNDSPLV